MRQEGRTADVILEVVSTSGLTFLKQTVKIAETMIAVYLQQDTGYKLNWGPACLSYRGPFRDSRMCTQRAGLEKQEAFS